jgi:hypothetical protein
MSAPRNIQREKSIWLKWFGTSRGTHWAISGAVAVIIFGSYLIYNSRGSGPAATATIPAAGERVPAPLPPGPFPSKK